LTPADVRLEPSGLCPLEPDGRNCGRRWWRADATADGAAPEWAGQSFQIEHCTRCDIRFTDPIPTQDALPRLYGGRTSRDFQAEDPPPVAVLKSLVARREVRRIARRAGAGPAARVLDYGCGNGARALALRDVLPGASIVAADWHDGPPWALRGARQPVGYASYAELRTAAEPFDLVYCRHVVEHTRDPVALLRELRGMLAPTGVLVVEVPSAATPLRRLFGPRWEAYYAPFHTIHLTERSLEALLDRAGLAMARLDRAEVPYMGRSMRNLIGRPYSMRMFALGLLLHPLQVAAGTVSGRGTCLRAYARAGPTASEPPRARSSG